MRDLLTGADPAWIVLAIVLEALSGVSYVLMFRPIFCRHMPWRTSWEISWSELAMGSIVPAERRRRTGPGRLDPARGRHAREQIARRSVAFF